jgi:hypothetical protein
MSSLLPPELGNWLMDNQSVVSIIILSFLVLLSLVVVIVFIKLDNKKHRG